MEVVGDRARQLAAAITGLEHWRVDGSWAIYQPPGKAFLVRVAPIPEGALRRNDRAFYRAILVRSKDGWAERNRPCGTPAEAIRWAESLDLG
jgi:hypothetical protein